MREKVGGFSDLFLAIWSDIPVLNNEVFYVALVARLSLS